MSSSADLLRHLGALTALRDRDQLDLAAVRLLHELLPLEELRWWQVVGEATDLRWHLRITQHDHQPLTLHALPWDGSLADAPPLGHLAEHDEVWRSQRSRWSATPSGCRGLLALTAEREAYGVLELWLREPPDPERREVVEGVLTVLRHVHALLDYGERDTLTGLLNRKSFDETFLRTAMPLAAPSPEPDRRGPQQVMPAWFAVTDIDHFKRVNDNFGHLIGDEVLVLVARLMNQTFRAHDRLYRFGGEEFVVLLRCPDEAAALSAFERLRRRTESYVFPQVGAVTVSVGFTEVRAGDTPADAFARADRAVYRAKSEGRNRVVSHAQLEREGEGVTAATGGEVDLF
jgi:diguanylate cyclase (GGDEF)-like protein